jgi:prolipoprotein diacylglyceryltransferase
MLVGIFGLRFLIEFFKEPEGMIFFGTISKTQMLNVPFILLGVAIFILMRTRKLTYNT